MPLDLRANVRGAVLWIVLGLTSPIGLAAPGSSLSVISLRGTLISVAPTRDGIVIAGDSRSTLGGQFCDDSYKLVEVRSPNPTVVSVPGIGIVFVRPPAGTSDLCAWVKTARRVLDIEAFAKGWLEANVEALTSDGILRLGLESLVHVRALVRFSPGAPLAYRGNNFYTIVVASYDRNGIVPEPVDFLT